jgi:hypothetical protein
MSYDYNALLSKIQQHRKGKEWQEAVDTFSTLSTHCPMTPLLWMQYAHDTSQLLMEVSEKDAIEVRVDTLELGLAEFPGCALLQLHYVELLLELLQSTAGAMSDDDNAVTDPEVIIKRVRTGFENAIQAVGRGSHRNEDVLVAQIYQRFATFAAQHVDGELAISLFLERAKIPMQQANDALQSELENFANSQSHGKIKITPQHLEELEDGRRQAATWFSSLVDKEDDVDEAMQSEHILSRYTVALETIDWDAIISNPSSPYWMGLGSTGSAQAFCKYAQICSRFPRNAERKEQVEWIHALAFPVYERSIAECPTIETVWVAYLKSLSWATLQDASMASTLQSVATRAVRNCPYSLTLAQFRIGASWTCAKVGFSILDPDSLVAMVEDIVKAKFLTAVSHHLELYLTVIRTIKRRILFVLAGNFDDCFDEKIKAEALTDAAEEEIQDLVEDLRELYDTSDKHLCKQQWHEGRSLLWADRSKTEAYLLTPLMTAMNGDDDAPPSATITESVRCFDKLLKLHAHPDAFRSYAQMLLALPASSAKEVAIKFQRMRQIYQKGLNTVSAKLGDDPLKEAAKHYLCNEYLEFELVFGSDKSYGIATRLVQKKVSGAKDHPRSRTQQSAQDMSEDRLNKKRKQETAEPTEEQSKPKKAKQELVSPEAAEAAKEAIMVVTKDASITSAVANTDAAAVMKAGASGDKFTNPQPDVTTANTSTEESAKQVVHKVKVGKMEYPAHPLTVRVSNLALEVEDMDLVDTFRPRCGAIVHAKIIREKQHHHHHGKARSKGWGLVQFETLDSVDKALALHDTIGLKEKLLHVDRSHMPAAFLVPPGMHRVKPKGEGKVSKRNQKRRDHIDTEAGKEPKGEKAEADATLTDETPAGKAAKKTAPASSGAGILAFQPRGVARKTNRKPKLSLK